MKSCILLIALATGLALPACKSKEHKYLDRLDGSWTIAHSERAMIYADGTVEVFEDIYDAGTLTVENSAPDSPGLKDYAFSYTNYQGGVANLAGLMFTDEFQHRVSFVAALCSGPFECDLIWTIDENKGKRQVWSAYGNSVQYFWPEDSYNPNNDDFHLRWTIVLEKD